MVTNSDYRIWDTFFRQRPAELSLKAEDRKLLADALIFRSRQDVGRVVFVCTPHRGSDLATNIVGRIGIALVRLPVRMVSLGTEATKYVITLGTAKRKPRFPTSIDTLSPKNRFVLEMNKLPIDSRVPYHSIIGDRGRGDSPNSSDGVVPYWSSHLDGAQSEKIVPTPHGSLSNPQTVEEIRRILLVNLGKKEKGKKTEDRRQEKNAGVQESRSRRRNPVSSEHLGSSGADPTNQVIEDRFRDVS
jgi:hypothetical protein